MTRDDPVQFGQRLDLVDNHLAHLRGVLGGFLRHFQHAAAKLVAGRLQFVMHFRSHLLHALHHGREPVGRLLEHRIRFLGALLIELAQGLGRQPAFLFGRGAHRLELAADRGRTRTGGFRHHPCDVAGALFGGGQRFIQEAGEARQPLVEIGGPQIDRGHQRIQRRFTLGDRGGGAAVALFDHRRGIDQRLAMGIELTGKLAEIVQRLRGLGVEDVQLVFQRLGGDAVARGDVVHGGHEVGDPCDQSALQRIEIVVGAGEHFLQQDIAFAQTLEQGDRVGSQDLAGFLHFGHRRDRDLARLVDRRPRGLLEVLDRLVDGAGGQFAGGRNGPRDVGTVRHHRLRERLSPCFDRFQRIRGDAVDIDRELAGLAAKGLDQGSTLAVDHLRQTIGLLLHIADDFVGLAGHGRAETAAG